jgi:hypothetical protein
MFMLKQVYHKLVQREKLKPENHIERQGNRPS